MAKAGELVDNSCVVDHWEGNPSVLVRPFRFLTHRLRQALTLLSLENASASLHAVSGEAMPLGLPQAGSSNCTSQKRQAASQQAVTFDGRRLYAPPATLIQLP